MSSEKSIKNWMGFSLFIALVTPLFRLPLKVLYYVSNAFAFLLYYFIGYRKKTVVSNLRNSFPDLSKYEINRVAKAFYQHVSDTFIESFSSYFMSEQEIRKRVVWKNLDILNDLYLKQKSVVAVIGHYGNWEWITSLPLHVDHKVLALYRPLQNFYFDRFQKDLRQKFGMQLVPVGRSYQRMAEYHNAKVPTITFFLSDQRPVKESARYWTKFMGQDTPVVLGAEQISKRLNQVVLFFSMNKIKRGYYEFEITPVTFEPADTKQFEITEMHTRLLEKQIIRKPEYWLWSHKRWKLKRETRHD